MQNNTTGEIISRVRTKIKQVSADNRLVTNKLVFSLLSKWREMFVQRQDARNRVLSVTYIFQTLPNEELIEVDKVMSNCTSIKSNCTIKRLRHKLPKLVNGYIEPIIRNVMSISGEEPLNRTTRSAYIYKANSPDFKYNHTKYYWYEEGYLYFPNLNWDAVMIEGYFEEDIEHLKCRDCPDKEVRCTSRLTDSFFFPASLIPELEAQVDNELRNMLGIPKDETINKNSAQ